MSEEIPVFTYIAPGPVPPVDLGDEGERYRAARAELERRGYRTVEHPTLRPGQRVRHRGERYPGAYGRGTGVVVAVLEHAEPTWGRCYCQPDIELFVLRDKPLLPGMSRLVQLADYHVTVVRTDDGV